MTHPALETRPLDLTRAGRRYYRRIALLSAFLCALILCAAAVATRRESGVPPVSASAYAPRCDDGARSDTVSVVAQTPNGPGVPRESAITATFSCPVDRRAVERAFVLYPPARGSFTWEGQTLVFTPAEPLRPRTTYRVTIFGGLSDARGFVDGRKVSWPFITRNEP